jgi:hypothetical protein
MRSPILAVERMLRAVLLVGVGLILPTHAHTESADLVRHFLEQGGLDPAATRPADDVALAEGGHGRRPFMRCSDGEGKFGGSCGEPVVRVEVDG